MRSGLLFSGQDTSWAALIAAIGMLTASHAFALSEIPEEDVEPPPEIIQVPLPPPVSIPEQADETDQVIDGDDAVVDTAPAVNLPEIQYDIESLPEPVRRMRQLIIEACKAGDIEALRPLIGTMETGTQVSNSGNDVDQIAFLTDISGDREGYEILAILQEVLEAGYVHLDVGQPNEVYLWPYFFAVPLDGLTGPQKVELFKLVTAGDYEDMKAFGTYIFYRTGITPDGRWVFFLAGH